MDRANGARGEALPATQPEKVDRCWASLLDRTMGSPTYGQPQMHLVSQPRAAEMRGLPLSELVSLRNKHIVWLSTEEYNQYAKLMQRKTMYDVVPNIIMRATAEHQVSYSELGPAHAVDFFVSHWWGHEFLDFVSSLEEFAKTIPEIADPVFWICSFANNQHKVDLGDSLADSPFEKALAAPSCKGVIMVLDPRAVTLTRGWCLYEVMRTHQLGHKFHMATHAGVITSIRRADDAMAASAELKKHALALAQALLSIDVGQTECSVESDKQAILKCVRLAVGRSQFNLAIQGFLADAGATACGFSGGSGDLTVKLDALMNKANTVVWSAAADESWATELHMAVDESLAAVEEVTERTLDDLNAQDKKGKTPLVVAAMFNKAAIACRLIELGADVTIADERGATALHWAAYAGELPMVQALVAAKADVAALGATVASSKGSPLHDAAKGGNLAVLDELIRMGADVKAADSEGNTALHVSAQRGQVAVMRRLVELGVDMEAVGGDGWTALGAAAMTGQVVALEALLGMGASVNGGEMPALFMAAMTGQVAAADALLSAGADVTATVNGWTAAELAAQYQQTAIVELLAHHSAQ